MTRAIDESRTGFSNGRQSNRHRIPIANRCTLKTRSAFNAVGLVEQLADCDPRFACVAFPFSDRLSDGIVQFKQAIMYRGQRGDSPKTFCSAEDRPSAASRPAVGIVLENAPAVLHHEYGHAAFALRILCGARAIRWLDFRRRDCRC